MNRKDLIKAVATKTGQPQGSVEAVIENAIEQIGEVVKTGGEVDIHAFGKFTRKDLAERPGRNPRDGSPITVPASSSVRFKPHGAYNKRIFA